MRLGSDTDERARGRFKRAWNEVVARELVDRLPAGATVLDLGCGRGDLLEQLVDAGFVCTGVDLDERRLALVDGRCLTVCASIEAVGGHLAGERYDAVVLSHVLEHTADPGTALEVAMGASAELVIVAVPNLTTLSTFVDAVRGVTRTVEAGHRQGWDRAHLVALLTNVAGLDLDRIVPDRVVVPTRLGSALVRFGWADRWERDWLARFVPGLSNSLIAVCRVPEAGPNGQ